MGDSQAAVPDDPQTLGRYEIVKKLGAGGMGKVFLAIDTELKRKVALKVLDVDKSSVAMFVRRFRSEAQAAATLQHPNIVAVYDSGSIDGRLYIALEYVEGTDVERLLQQHGRIAIKRSVNIIKQVAGALQHAFDQGIVHRDIKPSNIMITRDGTAKLTDMGLARSLDESAEAGITQAGTTGGTVDYMAPGQARNSKAADVRSDLYSLGCTWFHMLTGQPPYTKGSLTNKLQAHATHPIPDPREQNPEVPEALVAVVQRLMAKSSEERYQTPAELLADLERDTLTREGLTRDLLAALAEGEDDDDQADEQDDAIPSAPVATFAAQPPPGTTTSVQKPGAETFAPVSASPRGPKRVPAGPLVRVRCQACGKAYKTETRALGKRVRCPLCHEVMVIEASEPSERSPGDRSSRPL